MQKIQAGSEAVIRAQFLNGAETPILYNPSTSIQITITDSAGTAQVTLGAMTNESTGTYVYKWQSSTTSALGDYTLTFKTVDATWGTNYEPATVGFVLVNELGVATTPGALSGINADYLLSKTWAAPGTIGSTTPNTGAFTSLSATTLALSGSFTATNPVFSGFVTVNNSNNSTNFLYQVAGAGKWITYINNGIFYWYDVVNSHDRLALDVNGELRTYNAAGTQILKLTTDGYVDATNGFRIGGTALAATHLSNGTTGTGAVVLGTQPTFTTKLTINGASGSNNLSYQVSGVEKWATLVDGSTNFILYDSVDGNNRLVIPQGTGAVVLPNANDTLVGKATTDTLTNKTFNTAATGNVFQINGTGITAVTGTGAAVLATSPSLVTPLLGTPTSGTLTNTTGFPVANLAGAGTGVLTFLATPSSANLLAALTDETGTGAAVFGTSPTITTKLSVNGVSGSIQHSYQVAASEKWGVLVDGSSQWILYDSTDGNNRVVVPQSTAIVTFPTTTGTVALTANKLSNFAATTSAELAGVISDETGTGVLVFGTAPSFTTAITLLGVNNQTIVDYRTGGVSHWNHYVNSGTFFWYDAVGLGDRFAFTQAGALMRYTMAAPSTPTSGQAATYLDSTSLNFAVKNAAGTVNHGIQTRTATASNWIRAVADDGSTTISQPAVSDLSGFGTGVATFLGTPSSANLLAALTDETGTGAAVFGTTPTLTTPVIGAATGTSLNVSGFVAARGASSATANSAQLELASASLGGLAVFGADASTNATIRLVSARSDGSNALTLTMPSATDTLVGKATTDTLTNKTLTSPVITNLAPGANFTITNNSVAAFTSVNTSAVVDTLVLKAGLVGMGIAAPTDPVGVGTVGGLLHLAGTKGAIHLTNSGSGTTASDGAYIDQDTDGALYIYEQENLHIEFGTSNTARIRVGASGGLHSSGVTGTDKGANTINFTTYYAAGVVGVTQSASAVSVLATTAGIVTTFTPVSDERLKDWRPYTRGLADLIQLDPIRYHWNGVALAHDPAFASVGESYGYASAQNLQRVAPELVGTERWADGREWLTLRNDRAITGMTINAIKELNARLAAVEARP